MQVLIVSSRLSARVGAGVLGDMMGHRQEYVRENFLSLLNDIPCCLF
jgi:hypothetical protein